MYEPDIERIQMTNTFSDTIRKYCFRIIEQSKLSPAGNKITGKGILQNNQPAELPLLQAIRILRFLCRVHKDSIEPCFGRILSVLQQNIVESNGKLYLEVLRFLVEHSDPSFHLKQHFDIFFSKILPSLITDSVFSMEVLCFCNEYKERLLSSSTILQSYFPPILKLFCWSPMSNQR